MAVEKSIREEAFRRADRLHCSAAATLILAGDRNSWPQDRVDELRPLFGALLPSIDDLDEKFGKGYFVRNLPPAVAMYIGALLRHTVAAKWRGTTTLRDDAPLALGGIKANLGHSEPAAGMTGLIHLAQRLQSGDTGAPNAQLRILNPHVGGALRGMTAACALCVQMRHSHGISLHNHCSA